MSQPVAAQINDKSIPMPGMSKDMKRFIYILVGIAAGFVVYFLPFAMTEVSRRVMAVTVFVLTMFVFEAMPLGIIGLFGCWLYWVFAGIPVAKAFSGFHADSPWFILSCLVLGVMAEQSGLARRIAYKIVGKLGTNYGGILMGMMVVNFLLTFFIPSSVAKTVVMCAIAIGLIQAFGVEKKSNIARGLVLVMTFQASLFDKMILAGAGNILSAGLMETIANVRVSYTEWFIAFLPISIFTLLGCWFLTMWLFPPEKKRMEGAKEYCREELRKMGPMSSAEKKGLLILGLATLLWATDHWHHISPAKIGVIAGLVACLPVVGAIKKDDLTKVNYLMFIFVGSVLCLGAVMSQTEVLKTLTTAFFKWMAPILSSASVAAAMLLYWYSNILHLFLADLSLISAALPPLLDFSLANHFNPKTLGMLWSFSLGGKMFVYQQAALAIGYGLGYFTTKDLFKLGIGLFVLESILLLVIIPWYWPLIGLTFR